MIGLIDQNVSIDKVRSVLNIERYKNDNSCLKAHNMLTHDNGIAGSMVNNMDIARGTCTMENKLCAGYECGLEGPLMLCGNMTCCLVLCYMFCWNLCSFACERSHPVGCSHLGSRLDLASVVDSSQFLHCRWT